LQGLDAATRWKDECGGRYEIFKASICRAGVWGLVVVSPLYFLFDEIGRQNPPAITHPEFFYGFVAVTLA
jgi:hypothetical protein